MSLEYDWKFYTSTANFYLPTPTLINHFIRVRARNPQAIIYVGGEPNETETHIRQYRPRARSQGATIKVGDERNVTISQNVWRIE